MATKRIERVNELLKREVSKLILREIDFPQNCLVTVTRADVSSDLNQAKIYISIIPEDYSKSVLKILNSRVFSLQAGINRLLKMKKVPKIKIEEEEETKAADRIERVLEEIKKSKKRGHVAKPS